VWFKKASNLWSQSENLWEGNAPELKEFPCANSNQGIFRLIAAIMIFGVGISMLKLDRGKSSGHFAGTLTLTDSLQLRQHGA
jgi:high-affinity iron transporter